VPINTNNKTKITILIIKPISTTTGKLQIFNAVKIIQVKTNQKYLTGVRKGHKPDVLKLCTEYILGAVKCTLCQ